MTLKELYGARGPVVSIEFFPPRTPETTAKFEANLPVFKALHPAFCSLTMGAGGNLAGNTVDLVIRIKREFGLEAMCHFTCVGKSRDEVRTILGALRAGGIENIIALRGDPPKGETQWKPHPEGFKYSVELVKEARTFGGISIAVAGFPETHPEAKSPEEDMAYLKAKVDAGADAVISQFFFRNEDFLRFTDRARAAGIRVPIVAGILPIRTVAWVRRFAPICKASVPADLEAKLVAVGADDAACQAMGIEYASAQVRGLQAAGVTAYHFYCLNDPVPVTQVFRNVGFAKS
jgi:methylenetetrahydrofolate reductase (NADPH)